MLRNFCTLTLLIFGLHQQSFTQKKAIDHTVYDDWKDLKSTKLSNDGQWLGYIIEPQVGDGTFFLRHNSDKSTKSVFRGSKFEFGPESNYLIGRIEPGYDTIRTLKLADTKFSKLPKDSIFIWYLSEDSLVKFPKYSSYEVPDSGHFLVFKQDKSSWKAPKKRKCIFKKKTTTKVSSRGKDLSIINTQKKSRQKLLNVIDYDLSKNGQYLAYITQLKEDTVEQYQVYYFNLKTNEKKLVYECSDSTSSVIGLKVSDRGKSLSFLSSTDTSKNKTYDLHIVMNDASLSSTIIKGNELLGHENWSPSRHRSLRYSEDEKRLYFGIAPNPYNAPKDTLLSSEKYKVDIWHWQDKKLQPRQLLDKKTDEQKTVSCVYHLSEKRMVELGDLSMDYVSINFKHNHGKVLASSAEKFERSYDWNMPWLRTYYLVDELSGEKTMLQDSVGYGVSLSPQGKYAAYFDHKDSSWYVINLGNGSRHQASKGVDDPLAFDNNGSPYDPGGFGSPGWLENDVAFWFYSKHHIWAYNPSNTDLAQCLTCDGDKDNVYRYIHWDRDLNYIPADTEKHLSIYNETTKASGVGRIYFNGDGLQTKYLPNANMRPLQKAKNSDEIIFRQMSFKEYPDLYLTNLEFENPEKITETNPQQKDFKWGEVQLVNWTSYKGLELEGLLYTPEDMDSTKKYPMIVYFYEKYDKMLHNHYVPKPTASIVFPTEYVSNDYIVFIPNIEYTIGHPGKSAYDCILSGTDYLTNKYSWIDTTKMGLQGQSWGGYQTAYLVTQTDMYAAAMAGAPVSNMTSAYGGIRWGSGLNRMFQYEHTQSRIGTTLWDNPNLYIENSPLFFADKINTPILIMHNDKDGAVPWYQGIEYASALRRLNKPSWLLNYNGDGHNLMKRPNRVDLSIRMRQFFDHFLKDEPAPIWLKDGLPAVQKGRMSGYEDAE